MSEVRNMLCNINVNVMVSHAMLTTHFNVSPVDSMWVRDGNIKVTTNNSRDQVVALRGSKFEHKLANADP